MFINLSFFCCLAFLPLGICFPSTLLFSTVFFLSAHIFHTAASNPNSLSKVPSLQSFSSSILSRLDEVSGHVGNPKCIVEATDHLIEKIGGSWSSERLIFLRLIICESSLFYLASWLWSLNRLYICSLLILLLHRFLYPS